MFRSRPSAGAGVGVARGEPPSHPGPVRFDGDAGQFALRSGTTVAYTTTEVAPLVERFCSEIARRTGLRALPLAGTPGPDEPSVRVELGGGDELGVLPAPMGVWRTGDGPADERHALAIDADQVVVRAAEPVGVARGLTTLLQLLAATPLHQPSRGLGAGRADPRRTRVRLARAVARPRPHVLHPGRGPAGDRPPGALQAQRAAPAPERRPKLAPARGPAGRQARVRRGFLQRRGAACAGRLRRGPLRHRRSRARHPRARLRARAAASGVAHRSQRGRVRAPTRAQAPHRVARPGTARHLRAHPGGAGRRCRDLPELLYPHRR
jgi:Glycosyl hydrolase family 20, domain 2